MLPQRALGWIPSLGPHTTPWYVNVTERDEGELEVVRENPCFLRMLSSIFRSEKEGFK